MSTSTKTKKAVKKAAPKKANKGSQNVEPQLRELFIDGLKDIYWAEKHLTKVLPKMKKASTSEELATALDEHLEVTKNQITRLEEVFKALGEKAQAKKCDAMEGLSKEGDSIVEETEDGTATRDVGIILACQKVEHYEIASYGGLVQLAKTLGEDKVAKLLQETLDEEKEADETLTEVAVSGINYEAATEE